MRMRYTHLLTVFERGGAVGVLRSDAVMGSDDGTPEVNDLLGEHSTSPLHIKPLATYPPLHVSRCRCLPRVNIEVRIES